jgi:hypothetical protein
MKRFIKTVLPAIALLFLVQACYKDKGNYDLVDYNQILSIASTGSVSVIMGDTFRVNPTIKWKYPERDTLAYDYEWRQIDSVVYNKRNLAYTPDKPGYIMIYLYVTEKATGIVTRYAMQIQVISAYKAGWLLLTNKGGKSGLTYIRRDSKRDANNAIYYEYKYFPDIFEQRFPGQELGDQPAKLVTKVWPDYSLDEVLVLQGNSSVYLSGDDLSKKITLRSEFPNQIFPNSSKPVGYADGGPMNFILGDDGNIYTKKNAKTMGGLHDGLFLNVAMYFEGGGANITQMVETEFDNNSIVYVYDDLKKRFVGLYVNTGSGDSHGGKMFLSNTSTPPAGWVDLNNLTGYTMKYCSDYAYGAGYMNILKNNTTGEYLYQTYSLSMQFTSIGVYDQKQEVFAGSAYVSDNTVYYRIRNSSYLFFGEGSKLYYYDINTKKITLYHDFGAGKVIKITTDANSGELGVALDNGTFAVCSLKNDVLGNPNPGSVGILFKVNNVGNIVDLNWKWGSYFDYVFKRYPQ